MTTNDLHEEIMQNSLADPEIPAPMLPQNMLDPDIPAPTLTQDSLSTAPTPKVVTMPQFPEKIHTSTPPQFSTELYKKLQKKRKALTISLLSFFLVVLVGLVVFLTLWVPHTKYQNAMDALQNEEFDQARSLFEELGDYKDSETMVLECTYQEALDREKRLFHEEAIAKLESLGDYKDSPEKIREIKYGMAEKRLKAGKYQEAYLLFGEILDYSDSQSRQLDTMLVWANLIMDDFNYSSQATQFVETITLSPENYAAYYDIIVTYINKASPSSIRSENIVTMLKILPEDYERTKDLIELCTHLNTEGFGEVLRNYPGLIKKLFDLPFIQNAIKSNYYINDFLVGYWTTSGGSYYLNFTKKENGGTHSYYNLPWVSEPYGTDHYDIESMVYYYENANNQHLAKVFEFEIIDYNTLRVYCYKNGGTYLLYR